MGLFSGKKKTYVSSVAYPLGEDGDGRVESLKHTVLNATLQGRPVGESITQAYLRGQGMSLRNTFKYARDRYTHGVPTSEARYRDQPDTTLITPIVQPKYPGQQILYLSTMVGSADFEWWAEQHLTEKYGYDREMQEFISPPAGVDANAAVAYDLEPSGLIRILLMNTDGGTKVIDFRPKSYVEMETFLHCCYRARKIFIEKDETTTRPATVGEIDTVQNTTTIIDRVGESQERVERIETTITGDTATVHTKITVTVTTRPQYMLYELGRGTHPTLDAWLVDEDLLAPYYPSIPLRVDNEDMVASTKKDTELYKTSKKLLDRLGADIDKLGEQVNTNESIDDIDYAFVAFGVSLNTQSQEGQRYLYRYFEYLRGITGVDTTKTKHEAWVVALSGQPAVTPPPMNVVEIYSEVERENNHDIKLQWDYIDTTLHTGAVFQGARPGDVTITMGAPVQFRFINLDLTLDSSVLYACRQIDENTYEQLEVAGLVYENRIYKGKSVIITAYDAFNDVDEEGFIVPLSQQIVRSTPIVELTDLSYQCMHMVFNCYKIVKQKWYQTSWFKIVLLIIAIIVVVLTWGTTGPAVFGAYGAIIASMGILAIVLAATIYVVAMMVLMNILMKAAVQLFGEEWGPVIASIIAIVSMNWESLANTAATVANTGITATMVIQASIAGLQVYGAYNQGQMSEIRKKMAGLETEFDRKMKEIEDLSKANLDTNSDLIDIYGMTEATNHFFETSDTFLARTLLVGSDVCLITSGMIENFVDVGLQLPNTG